MKITKTQLKQIIKEELSSINEGDELDQRVVRELGEVVDLYRGFYDKLPDNESKELFEYYLNENVKLHTRKWQEDRKSPEEKVGEEI
tara:strand:- start:30 stop:290 length:261 start_codon:yes stop_codon:yes gene_type:complete